MSQRSTFNGPLTWSLLFMGGACVLVLTMLPSLLAAAFAPSASNVDVTRTLTEMLDEHHAALDTYEERFIGRSVFFKPKQPRPAYTPPVRRPEPNPAPVVRERPEPPEPPEPQKPARYGGPDIQVFIGEEVWFENGLRLRVGEDEVDGVQVVEVDAPWSATIAYQGWEFDVELFRRFSPDNPPPPSATDPDFFEKPGETRSSARRRAPKYKDDKSDAPRGVPKRPEKAKIPAE